MILTFRYQHMPWYDIQKSDIKGQLDDVDQQENRVDDERFSYEELIAYIAMCVSINGVDMVSGAISDIMWITKMERFSKENIASLKSSFNTILRRKKSWCDTYIFSKSPFTPEDEEIVSGAARLRYQATSNYTKAKKGEQFFTLDIMDVACIAKNAKSHENFVNCLLIYLFIKNKMFYKKWMGDEG